MMAYFELILLILTVASAIIGLVDIFFFEKKRRALLTSEQLALPKKERRALMKAPIVADYARSLFIVFLVVFLVRGFVAQPYRIPSGSMLPNLQIGDFIVVTQYDFGVRFPVWRKYLTTEKLPKRGDVVVLHYPVNPKIDFIKRVIGLPGDTITYLNKQLIINGHKIPQKFIKKVMEPADSKTRKVSEYSEDMFGTKYDIYQEPWHHSVGFHHLKVPKDDVFVMGDNRDNSDDSRYWGFVPVQDLQGRARFVWFSWKGWPGLVRWSRIGKVIQ